MHLGMHLKPMEGRMSSRGSAKFGSCHMHIDAGVHDNDLAQPALCRGQILLPQAMAVHMANFTISD